MERDLEELLEKVPESLKDLDSAVKKITVDDIYHFSLLMERKGIYIYSTLAEKISDTAAKEILLFLAKEETRHIAVLEERFVEALSPAKNTKIQESIPVLMVHMNDKFFAKDVLRQKLKKISDTETVFEFAMSMELDQILYYQEIKSIVRYQDLPMLETLIEEERKHFYMLLKQKQERM